MRPRQGAEATKENTGSHPYCDEAPTRCGAGSSRDDWYQSHHRPTHGCGSAGGDATEAEGLGNSHAAKERNTSRGRTSRRSITVTHIRNVQEPTVPNQNGGAGTLGS